MIVTSSEICSQRAVICLNFSLFVLMPRPTATAQTTIANTPPLLLNADTKLFGTALTMNSNGFEPLLPAAASRFVSTAWKRPAL